MYIVKGVNSRPLPVKRLVSLMILSWLILSTTSPVLADTFTQTTWEQHTTTPTLGVTNGTVENYYESENVYENEAGVIQLENTTRPADNIASHIVISEVCIGKALAGDEHVELYNPNDTPENLRDLTVSGTGELKLKNVTSTDTLQNRAITWINDTIPAKGYFLFAAGTITPAADATFSAALSTDGGVQITDANDVIIDRVAWGSPTPPSQGVEGTGIEQDLANGDSIERKAKSSSTEAGMKEGGEDYTNGNGFDTDNNAADFVIHSGYFEPQNTDNQTEQPPTVPAYKTAGWLVSSVFDAGDSAKWGAMSWTATTEGDSSLIVKARTSNNSDMSGATDWPSVGTVDNESDISSVTGVTDDHRYIQYRIELTASTDNTGTPIVSDITINYTTQSVTVDNVRATLNGVTTTINTFDATQWMPDANATVNFTLQKAPSAAPILYYDNDTDPSDGPSVTATLVSGTSYYATIDASNENVDNAAPVYFIIVVDGTTYYRTGTTAWSYKVDGDAPTNVGLDASPDNNDTNVVVGTSLNVLTADDSGSGSIQYYIELATDTAFTSGVQTSGWQSGVTWYPSLNAGTVYYWRVRARDAVGNESDNMSHSADSPGYGKFTTAVGQAVGIAKITDGTNEIAVYDGSRYLLDQNATVSIALNQSSSGVKLIYDDSSAFTSPTVAVATGSGTSWTATISASDSNVYDGGTVYFVVEVAGENYDKTETGTDAPWAYKVDGSAPTNVALDTPAENAIGVSASPTLKSLLATDAGAGLHSTPYYFELATDAGFSQNIQKSDWQASNTWSPSLVVQTSYYWRVKVRDRLGNQSVFAGHTADTTGYSKFTTIGMSVSLTTDKSSYELGQVIQVSGVVQDASGNAISSGTATIQFTLENWYSTATAQITNGVYSYNFQTSFAYPDGTWLLTVSAVDSVGNTGENSKSISVSLAATTAFYNVNIVSPVVAQRLRRGDSVRITSQVKHKDTGAAISGATVSFTTPTGQEENMREDTATSGTYIADYTIGPGAQVGGWTISVGASKREDNVLFAGVGYINVEIVSTQINITLESPKESVEVGKSILIKVKATYPDGTPAEGVSISVITPSGENVVLIYDGSGFYSKSYTVAENDVGTWNVQASGTDLYGNIGTSETTDIVVTPPSVGSILLTYWWAFLAVFGAVGAGSAYFVRRTMLVRKLNNVKKEMKEIPKLKKEAMVKYFKEGSIERDTYDELMDKHDMRLGELKKQEELLSVKLGKKSKLKPQKGKKK